MGRSRVLPVYVAVAAADVVLAAKGNRKARRITKPALMPLLALHVATTEEANETRPLVLAGLGLSGVGDVALLGQGEGSFALGLSAFLAAHGCYLAAFAKRRGGGVRRARAVVALYVLVWCGLNAVLLPRTGKLRIPVLVYGTALTAMALAALDTGDGATAAGGAAFVASDSILALRTFGGATIPGADALVMLTYTTAEALIAEGVRSR